MNALPSARMHCRAAQPHGPASFLYKGALATGVEAPTTLKEQDERTSGDSSHIDEGDDDSEDMEEATGVDV